MTATMGTPTHFVSAAFGGEICGICFRRDCVEVPATHKVGEEMPHDAPREILMGHNLTQYVCCADFVMIFGPATQRWRMCE